MNDSTKHIFADRQTLIVSMAEIKELMSMEECIELKELDSTRFISPILSNQPSI